MRKTMSESAVAPAFSRCRIVVMSSSSPPGGVPPRADTASVSVWLTVGGAISEAPGGGLQGQLKRPLRTLPCGVL